MVVTGLFAQCNLKNTWVNQTHQKTILYKITHCVLHVPEMVIGKLSALYVCDYRYRLGNVKCGLFD